MGEKITIKVGDTAKVETWRDGEWTILYVEDGGGGVTTISLTPSKALDLANLLRGSGISACYALERINEKNTRERMSGTR